MLTNKHRVGKWVGDRNSLGLLFLIAFQSACCGKRKCVTICWVCKWIWPSYPYSFSNEQEWSLILRIVLVPGEAIQLIQSVLAFCRSSLLTSFAENVNYFPEMPVNFSLECSKWLSSHPHQQWVPNPNYCMQNKALLHNLQIYPHNFKSLFIQELSEKGKSLSLFVSHNLNHLVKSPLTILGPPWTLPSPTSKAPMWDKKTASITTDLHHLGIVSFLLLQSVYNYRKLKSHTARFRNSYFPTSIMFFT